MVYPKFLSRLFFLLFPIADHNLTGQTHQKYSWRLYSLFSYNQCITLTQISRNVFAARRGQRQSHEKRIVALAFAIRLQTLGTADKRGRSDALSVRFVRSVWKSVICARMFWCVYPVFPLFSIVAALHSRVCSAAYAHMLPSIHVYVGLREISKVCITGDTHYKSSS